MPRLTASFRQLAAGALLCAGPLGVPALAEEPLPEPLTFEYALSLADAPHPDLALARAAVGAAAAERLAADALTDTRITAQGRLAWVEPSPVAADQSNSDHSLGLFVDKRLYDFGRTRAARAAGRHELAGREFLYLDARQERRLTIMRRFFDVVLADLRFMRDNEQMAIEFVDLDRRRDRHELGQISDIELLEQETRYQEIRRRRAESEHAQRVTRALLAQALGRPGMLPSNVAPPTLSGLDAELPEIATFQEAALHRNPTLLALRAQVEAAQARVTEARAADRPVLSGRLEAYAWDRVLGSSDDYRAGIVLDLPLRSGRSVDARVAEQQARLDLLRAELAQTELAVRQAVLETWLRLEALRIQREEASTLRDYRELYLDRSRALYDMEAEADLGDAMVRMSEVQLELARTEFETAMNWARLRALSGELIGAGPVPTATEPEGEQAGT